MKPLNAGSKSLLLFHSAFEHQLAQRAAFLMTLVAAIKSCEEKSKHVWILSRRDFWKTNTVIQHSSHPVVQAHISPDERWIAFHTDIARFKSGSLTRSE
jgi:hypothetical protein